MRISRVKTTAAAGGAARHCGGAALALFAFNIVAVLSYPDLSDVGLNDHILWGTLMLVLAVYGPGKLSVDGLVSRTT
jgi:uncharacterized membrane protein YphA (DoxX/SURF4 family)